MHACFYFGIVAHYVTRTRCGKLIFEVLQGPPSDKRYHLYYARLAIRRCATVAAIHIDYRIGEEDDGGFFSP